MPEVKNVRAYLAGTFRKLESDERLIALDPLSPRIHGVYVVLFNEAVQGLESPEIADEELCAWMNGQAAALREIAKEEDLLTGTSRVVADILQKSARVLETARRKPAP